ncbi:IS66 Orf2 like protein [compost metagenome]
MFDPVLFVFLDKLRNRVNILYWERNGFCVWLKRLESERFKTSPDVTDEAIVLTVQELNWMLDGLFAIHEIHLLPDVPRLTWHFR